MRLKTTLFFTVAISLYAAIFSMSSTGNNSSSSDEVIAIKTAIPTETVTGTGTPTVTPTATIRPKPIKKIIKKISVKPTATIEPTPADDVGRLIARVRTAQKARSAMKCDMVMITSYTDANTTQEVKGDLVIRKPDKFRVNYTEPQKQLLISNGKMLWVYTPVMNQVVKQDIKSANLNTHFYIEFESSIDYYAKKSVNTLSEDDNNYILTMVPKKGETEFDRIVAMIEKKTLIPVSMKMTFENTVAEVKFSNIVTYKAEEIEAIPELALSKFNFKTPEGVEEVDASSMLEGTTK